MDSLIVTIKQGQLKGCIRSDSDGGKFISFLGIPYATPPVGDLRFKAPLPAAPWHGIWDATKEGNNCYSRDLFFGVVQGSEDCLNLNVFTKRLPDKCNSPRPVMVWIHGGAFVTGSNKTRLYGPEFLMTQDIVLVSINYRLGALGFLSSDDPSLGVPGNAGLKDQALALKWVQENIINFNGDSNNVTIFGESAGSASVHYQILSPTTKGLFHKAILQSGCALNHWSVGQQVIMDLAREMGHVVNGESEALNILKSASVESLFEAQERLDQTRKASGKLYYAPVIEKPNDTAFITQDPIDIIRSGNYNKVPMIFGYNTREGLLLAVHDLIATMSGKPIKRPNTPNLEDAIPWQIGLQPGSSALKQTIEKLTKLYFRGPDLVDNTYILSSDSLFIAAIIAALKNHSKTSGKDLYLYRMSVETKLNLLKNFAKLKNPGVCHGDELGYLFKNALSPPIEPASLEDVSFRRFVKLWTNFATYGNPVTDHSEFGIAWKPVEKENYHFLDIGSELTTGVNPEAERMELWREIYNLSPVTSGFL